MGSIQDVSYGDQISLKDFYDQVHQQNGSQIRERPENELSTQIWQLHHNWFSVANQTPPLPF